MAERETDEERSARRKRFLNMFPYFSPDSRYPAPYTQFAGKPGKQVAKNGWSYDALGYRNAVHADARPAAETLRVFVVGDSTMVEGHTIADTVPGLLEAVLRRTAWEVGARRVGSAAAAWPSGSCHWHRPWVHLPSEIACGHWP